MCNKFNKCNDTYNEALWKSSLHCYTDDTRMAIAAMAIADQYDIDS